MFYQKDQLLLLFIFCIFILFCLKLNALSDQVEKLEEQQKKFASVDHLKEILEQQDE